MGFVGLAGCNMPNPTNSTIKPGPQALASIPAPSGEYYSTSEVTTPPFPTYQVVPIYPHEYKSDNVQGEAIVSFVVEKDGTVQQARVLSATREGFGYSALQSVVRWRFRPGRMNGQPVRFLLQVPIKFMLESR